MRQMLLHFYPHAWRLRYGAEFSELLVQIPLTPRVLLDTLQGALDAHLHPPFILQPKSRIGNRMRHSFLLLSIAAILLHPRRASAMATPRRLLGSAFMA